MDKYAVIAAGGSGLRMGTSLPKQFLLLRNKPVLWHSLSVFLNVYPDIQIVLALPEQHFKTGESIIQSTGQPGRIKLVPGGETRFDSVRNGLTQVTENSIVFVHDAVRCLVSPKLIQRCYETALNQGNAIPAIIAVDSMRVETASGFEIIDRNKLRIIQTPQTFSGTILKKAFRQDYQPAFTDEASVVENIGERIYLVEGEATNIKITRQIDLLLAEKILEERSQATSGGQTGL